MAEAPTAQEATPSHPSRPTSPHDQPADERNDEAAGDESAPLLQPGASDGRHVARFTQSKFIHFLTSLALSSAVFALVLVIVTSIVSLIVPYGYQIPYMTRDAMTAVVVPVSDGYRLPRSSKFDEFISARPSSQSSYAPPIWLVFEEIVPFFPSLSICS